MPSAWPKTLKVDVPTVLERLVDPTELEGHVEPAQQDKDVLEEHVFVTEGALGLSVDQTDVEPLVEIALLDKHVFQGSVLELVHHNVFDQMEQSEVVDGTDVEDVVEAAHKGSDAEMEHVNVTQIVRTNIVEVMDVEEVVEVALMELFAKAQQILILNNVTSIVKLIFELKSEN